MCAPAVFKFTAPACPERHLRVAVAMGADPLTQYVDLSHKAYLSRFQDAGQALSDRLLDIMHKLDIPNGLQALGYTDADIPDLVKGTLPQHRVTKLSPRPADEEALTRLFAESMSLY